MTTAEFEKELRRVQKGLELTEEHIQSALDMHRKLLSGEVTTEELRDMLGIDAE